LQRLKNCGIVTKRLESVRSLKGRGARVKVAIKRVSKKSSSKRKRENSPSEETCRLTEDRINIIRERLRQGFYSSPEVAEFLADRMSSKII
jgi:hypothetical protein